MFSFEHIKIAIYKKLSIFLFGQLCKGYNSGYGNYIEIEHAGGFRSFYAHLSKSLVSIGDIVSITQQIAFVGNSGLTTGSHLHYEVRKGKYHLNPAVWYDFLWKLLIDDNE